MAAVTPTRGIEPRTEYSDAPASVDTLCTCNPVYAWTRFNGSVCPNTVWMVASVC